MRLGLHRARIASCAMLLAAGAAFTCGGSSESPPDGSAGAGGEGTGGARSCDAIEDDYSAALEEAKSCSPSAPTDECTERVIEGLACSCPTYANPSHSDAIARVAEAADAFRQKGCGSGIVCGPCQVPTGGRCSEAGLCENVYETEGRGCKVDGQVFAHGEGGIPDPVSCNTCTCDDGQLVCTEIYCPEPCAEGTAYGVDCAECGPTDACLVVEHACFPSCVDACDDGAFCSNGVCLRGLCG